MKARPEPTRSQVADDSACKETCWSKSYSVRVQVPHKTTCSRRSLVARLEAAQRPTDLGDTAILTESTDAADTRIRFVRNNVYVAVRGHGDFASEALSVARSIDGRIVTQQPLTYEGLIARRPTVTLDTPTADDLFYELDLSPGQRLVDVHARVGGQRIAVSGQQVPLSAEQKQAVVEVVAIGEDLLVGVAATAD